MSDCVLWAGEATDRGYGILLLARQRYRAHRVFYMLYNGKIPRGHVVHHTCENKLCVNPRHLVAVTRSQHRGLHGVVSGRGALSSRARSTHCRNGHEYTPDNTWRRGEGMRTCRTCALAKFRRRYARMRATA